MLVLSEMAGAADELTDALLINPNDATALTHSLYSALTMKLAERRRRIVAMQQRIKHYTVQAWGGDFLSQLQLFSSTASKRLPTTLSQSGHDDIIKALITSKHRLLLLDYDGTLHEFTKSIGGNASKPSRKLHRQLSDICAQTGTVVCIVSGRPRQTLDSWFGSIPQLILVAEHGSWIKEEGVWHARAKAFDKQAILTHLHSYAMRTPGAVVEEKDFTIVWHYRQTNPELAYIRNSAVKRGLQELVEGTDLEVHNGNKIIEIKPADTHKGAIAAQLIKTYPSDFIFAAGDDYTDESTFAALPDSALSLKVGSGETCAKQRVPGVENILDVIESMIKIIR